MGGGRERGSRSWKAAGLSGCDQDVILSAAKAFGGFKQGRGGAITCWLDNGVRPRPWGHGARFRDSRRGLQG